MVGFELLYRPATPDAPSLTGEQMTAQVVLGALSIGINRLVGDKTVFCNAERGVLTGATPVTLPPAQTVIEVLESVRIDDEAVAGCRDLVDRGYRIALDDFLWCEGAERLLELAAIVKIDFQAGSRDEVRELAHRCRAYDVTLLAEKVETDDDVAWAREAGFDLFQGYAVERPLLVRGRSIAPSAVTHVQLALSMLTEDLDFDELDAVLRREPGLVVQVLQMASLGSSHGLRRPVRTVREALVLLGSVRIRQWIALTLLSGRPAAGPDGLATALVRARMCELLAGERTGLSPDVAFTAGMLSALDLLLGVPVADLAGTLDLDSALTAAAFDRSGPLGALVDEVAGHQERVRGAGTTYGAATALDAAAAAAFAWAMPCVSALETAH